MICSLLAGIQPAAAGTGPNDFSCAVDGLDITWTDAGAADGEYFVRANDVWEATVSNGLTYTAKKNNTAYTVIAWVAGTKFTADCGTSGEGGGPVDPEPADFTCSIDGMTITWTDQGTDKYFVRANDAWEATVTSLSHTAKKNDTSYTVVTYIAGEKLTTDCGTSGEGGGPVDPEPADFTCSIDGMTITWTDQGTDKYFVRANDAWEATVTSLSHTAKKNDTSYTVVTYIAGEKLTTDCGTSGEGGGPVDPEPADFTCSIDGMTITWTDQGTDKYFVQANGVYEATVTSLTYTATKNDTAYTVVAWIKGVKTTADCGTSGEGGGPVDPEPVTFTCSIDGLTLSWNDINASNYFIQADGQHVATTANLTYEGENDTTYAVVAWIQGEKLEADCGSTDPGAPNPPTLICEGTVNANGRAVLTWNEINPENGNYRVYADGALIATVNALGYQDVAGKSYEIRATVNGVTVTGDCGDTPAPAVPAVCSYLAGPASIDEGQAGEFYVVLNKPALTNMTFTISTQDGSAKWVGNENGVNNQRVLYNGYWQYYIFVPVATYHVMITDKTPQIGPWQNTWDYSVIDFGVSNSRSKTVTVQAGATTSNSIRIEAWKEYMEVDLHQGGNHVEPTEYFQLYVNGTHCNKQVTIYDKTYYNLLTPIAIDLEGDGIQTTHWESSDATFDLMANGTQVRSGWTSDALLAVDSDNDGVISSTSELFGGSMGEGFAKLSEYDTNGDGVVDASDADFDSLSLWIDADGDRITDAGELVALSDHVLSISLDFEWDGSDDNDNVFGETSSAVLADGTTTTVVDLYFSYEQ